jgi:hypothetical protein
VSRPAPRRGLLAGLALTTAVVLVGAACGGSDEEQDVTIIEDDGSGVLESPDDSSPVEAVSGMPDPCSLVTDDEVAAAVDVQPSDTARAQLTPTSAACTFRDGEEPLVIVGVEVDLEGTILSADDYEETAEAIDAEQVEGLGDAAIWSPILGSVQAFQDDRMVEVTMIISEQDPDDLRQPAVDLAGAALGRL